MFGKQLIGKDKINRKQVIFLLVHLFLEESISSWINNPRVVIRALHTGVEADRFSGQFSGSAGTSVWQRAQRLSLRLTSCLPFLKVSDGYDRLWVLHPLDHLHDKDMKEEGLTT